MKTTLNSLLITACICGIAGCLDFTPVTASPDDDAGSDAASDAGNGEDAWLPSNACSLCGAGAPEAGGQCASAYAACADDPKCAAMFACGVRDGCFAEGASFVDCITPCGQKAGVVSASDPTVATFTPLYVCMTQNCTAACTP
jgi:hypothetical protein